MSTVVASDGSFVDEEDLEEYEIDVDEIFDGVGYAPHSGQIPVHNAVDEHRNRLAACGRRFGKSQIGGHDLTVAAHLAYIQQADLEPKGKRHEYWIVGPEYSDAEKEFRVLYNDLKRLDIDFDRPGTYYSEGGGDMDVSLFGGRFQVHAKSAKYPQTLVGEGLMGVVMAEAAKLKSIVWTQYIRPTLADFAREGSWALFTSTPEGKNWFYDLYMRGQSRLKKDEQWWSIRRPSWTNSIVFPGGRYDPEILEMEADMSAELFKQEIEADFTDFVGRVFKDFGEETHVGIHDYNPRWPVFLAADKGYRAPSVVLFVQQDVFNNVWVCGEYYRTDRDAEEVCEDILDDPRLREMANAARLLFPDPASPEWASILEKKLNVRSQGGTGGELDIRLNLIRRWLRPQPFELADDHPEKIPKLMFDQSCKNTIREMLDYRYPETKDEQNRTPDEKPLKVDDHTPEALGRFFAGHIAPQAKQTSGARVSRARMRARNR
jgi:hypothetical protein